MKGIIVAIGLLAVLSVNAPAQSVEPRTRSLVDALKAEGSFTKLLELVSRTKMPELDGKAKEQITVFAPNDAAFAKLSSEVLDGLNKNTEKRRKFLLSHIVKGKVMIEDMLVPAPGEVPGRTLLKLSSFGGSTISILCDLHKGEHHPRINLGASRIGKGDIVFSNGTIHEVDAVLAFK